MSTFNLKQKTKAPPLVECDKLFSRKLASGHFTYLKRKKKNLRKKRSDIPVTKYHIN